MHQFAELVVAKTQLVSLGENQHLLFAEIPLYALVDGKTVDSAERADFAAVEFAVPAEANFVDTQHAVPGDEKIDNHVVVPFVHLGILVLGSQVAVALFVALLVEKRVALTD